MSDGGTGGTTGTQRIEWNVHADGGRLWVADGGGDAAPGRETAWFECDAVLQSNGEAMGTTALIPALDAGLRATIDRPADTVWLEGASQAVALLREWWGYPDLPPAVARVAPGGGQASEVGLCFTGGVDSFYNLLFGATPVDALL